MKIWIVVAFLLSFILLEGCRNQKRAAESDNFQDYINQNITTDLPENRALINVQF